jgi:hypothetical protein
MLQKLKARQQEYLRSRFQAWTGLNSDRIEVFRSNRLIVFLVMIGLTVLAGCGYNFHPKIANLLSEGFLFFHFPKIFNLKIPEPIFFTQIAQYFLIALIGFHWISLEFILLEYFFSCLYLAKSERIIIYIQSNLFKRKIHILKEKTVQHEFEDTLISRIFGIGTLTLHLGNGESWKIRSISKARLAMNEIISFDKN